MTLSRREFLDFLKASCAVAALPGVLSSSASAQNELLAASPVSIGSSEALVNDIHSQLNATLVNRIIRPLSTNDLRATILTAKTEGKAISIAGGRHSMGGQQFGTATILIDMTGMSRVLSLDAERGIVEVEAGIEWPELLDYLSRVQAGREKQWGIMQKQTGADRLSIGGALAYVYCDGASLSTLNFNTFSQVAFSFRVTPTLLARGLAWALLIGAAGGLPPAIRAARLPVTVALRTL